MKPRLLSSVSSFVDDPVPAGATGVQRAFVLQTLSFAAWCWATSRLKAAMVATMAPPAPPEPVAEEPSPGPVDDVAPCAAD